MDCTICRASDAERRSERSNAAVAAKAACEGHLPGIGEVLPRKDQHRVFQECRVHGGEFEEVVGRLEAGEDPESIEASMDGGGSGGGGGSAYPDWNPG